MKNKILLIGIIIISCLTGFFIGIKFPHEEKIENNKIGEINNSINTDVTQGSASIIPLTNEKNKNNNRKE